MWRARSSGDAPRSGSDGSQPVSVGVAIVRLQHLPCGASVMRKCGAQLGSRDVVGPRNGSMHRTFFQLRHATRDERVLLVVHDGRHRKWATAARLLSVASYSSCRMRLTSCLQTPITESPQEQLGRKPDVHILIAGALWHLMKRMRRARDVAVQARVRRWWRHKKSSPKSFSTVATFDCSPSSRTLTRTGREATRLGRDAQPLTSQACEELDGGCGRVYLDRSLRTDRERIDVVDPTVRVHSCDVRQGLLQHVMQQCASPIV